MTQILQGHQTRAGSKTLLSGILSGPVGTASQLRLFNSSLSPGPDTPASAFEAAEATFDGYVPVDLEFGPPGISPSGKPFAMSQNAQFTAGAAAEGELIAGAWLHTSVIGPPATENAVLYCVFNPPIPISQPDVSIGLKVVLTAPDTSSQFILED